jgi:uncharacterized membrane protein YczE
MPANRWLLRVAALAVGLTLFGISISLLVDAGLGLDPWDVLHQGLAAHAGVPLGDMVIATSAVVLVLWIPLRQRPGIGTLSNAVLVGLVVDVATARLPHAHGGPARCGYLAGGIAINGVATGLYIGAGLGPGARDGLMTGLAARGLSIGRVRAAIEVTVLAAGWLLGGTVGIGTLAYAVCIGPLVHVLIPRLAITGALAGDDGRCRTARRRRVPTAEAVPH